MNKSARSGGEVAAANPDEGANRLLRISEAGGAGARPGKVEPVSAAY